MRFYPGSSMELGLLSTSILTSGDRRKLTTPRFTALLNIGLLLHGDLSPRFGIYSGLTIKNAGLINRSGDTSFKYRAYMAGVPFGIKLGNLRNRNFFIVGGGVDFPIAYKAKTKAGGERTKRSEFFSSETKPVLGYAFAGVSMNPGLVVKLQYYFSDFLDHKAEGISGRQRMITDSKLILLSAGIDIHYFQGRIQEADYQRRKRRKR